MSLYHFYLLRHAKAVTGTMAQDDKERELAPRGIEDAERLGEYLSKSGMRFDYIYCSSAVRTRQTLEHLQHGYGKLGGEVELADQLYHASAARMLELLQQAPDSAKHVLMIGHNPGISELAAQLAHNGKRELLDEARTHFPTCTLAVCEFDIKNWEEATPKRSTIIAFYTPKLLQIDQKIA